MIKKAVALIISYMIIIVLGGLGAAFLIRSITYRNIANKHLASAKAFWLAEAGVNRALYEFILKGSLPSENNPWRGSLYSTTGDVEYLVDIDESIIDGDSQVAGLIIIARGFFPTFNATNRVERAIKVEISKVDFYGHAMYAANGLVRKGEVRGDVVYAGIASGSYKDPQPREVQNPSIRPLPLLDFEKLKIISQSQNNYYTSDPPKESLPTNFWYQEPNGENPGIPNIVFLDLQEDFSLNGKNEVAGFFVVGGEGDGEVVYDTTISGNVSIDGCIYTRGPFTIQGGGGANINVKGLWVGGVTSLGGSSVIGYDDNDDDKYMQAIKALNVGENDRIKKWQEIRDVS